jgi:hypothetical protein
MTSSHRSDTARLAVIYALQAAKLAQDMAEYFPGGRASTIGSADDARSVPPSLVG